MHICTCHFKNVNEFAEGETIKTEPENDRPILTPDMSNIQPFDRTFIPSPSTAVGHNCDGYEIDEDGTIKTEPEFDWTISG